METLIAVFTNLGVDSSLITQFIIILIAYVIVNFLFLGRLQSVLEGREEKTVKLENTADETIAKVETMQADYKKKLDEGERIALQESNDKKQKLTLVYSEQYKVAEREVSTYVDESRTHFEQEIASKKEGFMSDTEDLAQSLVNKILQ